MGARRELAVAVSLCLLGAVLVLLAAGRPWARVLVEPGPPLPPETAPVPGRTLTAVPGSLGLLGLAAVAALLATRRNGRVAVGVLLAVAGIAVAVVSLRTGLDAGPSAVAALSRDVGSDAAVPDVDGTAWPYLSAVGGALLAAAGAMSALRGRSWAAMSGRYDAPGTASRDRPAAKDPDAAAWDALDRGEDPTAS
jgi:uncharacterized membrane protein (TIGR02234 family)